MRPLLYLLIVLISAASCASSSIAPDRMRPITGTWRTGQDMIVEIGSGDEDGYAATVKVAPGFYSGDISVGAIVMSGIRAQADGSFTGTFVVPDAEPANVRIALVPPDRLMIVTRDKRIRGGTMIWYRVPAR